MHVWLWSITKVVEKWSFCARTLLLLSLFIPIFTFCSQSYKCMAHFTNNSFPKSRQKGETKRNFNQLKHAVFSVSLRRHVKAWFPFTANSTTTTKNKAIMWLSSQSFPLIALFWLKIGRCHGRNWLYGNQTEV